MTDSTVQNASDVVRAGVHNRNRLILVIVVLSMLVITNFVALAGIAVLVSDTRDRAAKAAEDAKFGTKIIQDLYLKLNEIDQRTARIADEPSPEPITLPLPTTTSTTSTTVRNGP